MILHTLPNCWRTSGGAEVDLLLEMDGIYYPMEFKAKSHPQRSDIQGLLQFMKDYSHLKIATGVVIHGGDEIYKLADNVIAIPWHGYFPNRVK